VRFDLVDMRLFLAVVAAGSITGGAERTGLALASASARIRGMEAVVGTTLLARSRAGLVPTPAGEALVHHAGLLVQQNETMRGELARYGKGLKGHVRLWCNTAALAGRLPHEMGAFLARHPDVDMEMEEHPSRQIALALAQGRIHIGILSDAVDTSGLETFPFGSDELVAILPRGHPLAQAPALRLTDLLAEPFVGLPAGNAMQELVARQALRLGTPLKYRVRMNGFAAVADMVEAGVGIAILPRSAAQRAQAARTFLLRPLAERWTRRQLVVTVQRAAGLPAYARPLLAHLLAAGSAPETAPDGASDAGLAGI